MKVALGTSEFWMAAAVVLGQVLVFFGVVDKATWDTVLWPAVVYIVGRVASKFAKAVNG